MPQKIKVDPITRIEGHFAIETRVKNGKVEEAKCKGEMFRGFENILRNRDPMDAQVITQRICGVCPISHGLSSVLAQEMACDVSPTRNGKLLRNLIQASDLLSSHIAHFYHLSALDYVDVSRVLDYGGTDHELHQIKSWIMQQKQSNVVIPAAPFLPHYENMDYATDPELCLGAIKNYVQGLRKRCLAHKMGAVFSGKQPHSTTLVPGGVTEKITAQKIAAFKSMLHDLHNFIRNSYIPDILAVAQEFSDYFEKGQGYNNYLVFGGYPDNLEYLFPPGVILEGEEQDLDLAHIKEETHHSFFENMSAHPSESETVPDPESMGYSWVKAPRYNGHPMEVGPLARMLVGYSRSSEIKDTVDEALRKNNLGLEDLKSVMGRHLARGLEADLVAEKCFEWLEELEPEGSSFASFDVCERGEGYGVTEAPRGALGHWLSIQDYKIDRYQCVVPTTWNCSPRCDRDIPGPLEKMLTGLDVSDPDNPIEIGRVVRSLDPCLACAIH